MTPDEVRAALFQPDEETVEMVARIVDPSAWAVMDSYRQGNPDAPADRFRHSRSMGTARAILAAQAGRG